MKKLLLIDDDVRLLGTLRRLLESDGRYEVVTEDSGRRALEAMATIQPDLIVLDMNMPAMSGVEFLTKLLTPEGTVRYPVLVLTSRANMEAFFDDVAVDGFMSKPCDPVALRKEVDRIVLLRETTASTQAAAAAGPCVFIGEDDNEVSGRLVAAFEKAGYTVACIPDGPELLQKVIMRPPDALVVKRILTNLNGDAVARTLAELPNTKAIPVVLYDRAASDETNGASKPGVRTFVASDRPDLLVAAVNAVLARRP